MGIEGLETEPPAAGDRRVGTSFGHQRQDVELARRQAFEGPGARGRAEKTPDEAWIDHALASDDAAEGVHHDGGIVHPLCSNR